MSAAQNASRVPTENAEQSPVVSINSTGKISQVARANVVSRSRQRAYLVEIAQDWLN
jgi:hypothetical protein